MKHQFIRLFLRISIKPVNL